MKKFTVNNIPLHQQLTLSMSLMNSYLIIHFKKDKKIIFRQNQKIWNN